MRLFSAERSELPSGGRFPAAYRSPDSARKPEAPGIRLALGLCMAIGAIVLSLATVTWSAGSHGGSSTGIDLATSGASRGPAITIDRAPGQASISSDGLVRFSVVASVALDPSTLTPADFAVSGGAFDPASLACSAGGTVCSFAVRTSGAASSVSVEPSASFAVRARTGAVSSAASVASFARVTRGPAEATAQVGRWIVTFKSGTTAAAQAGVLRAAHALVASRVEALGMYTLDVRPSDTSVLALAADPAVASVAPDRARGTAATSTDPLLDRQWALDRIGWAKAKSTAQLSGDVVVAVLDTGVDATHPELAGQLVAGWNVLAGTADTSDPNGHGTAMAGLIAARTDNGHGMAGVAWDRVKVMPITVLDRIGVGSDSDIVAGVVWAVDHGARVINMSFANPGYSAALQAAVDYAWSKGAIVVAATGNGGNDTATYPAGLAHVLGVTATTASDAKADFANGGPATALGAPGVDVLSLTLGRGYTNVSGTSVSAAEVSGAAAVLAASDPSASNGVIVGRLESSAAAVPGADLGHGRLDLAAAVASGSSLAVDPAGVAGDGTPVGPYVAAAGSTTIVVPFTSSGTWTAPVGVTSLTVELWGGGGGGGGSGATTSGGGGGAGGQFSHSTVNVTPGTAYAISVGAGGAGGVGGSGANNGTAGGDSSFASTTVVAKGGAGGTGVASANSTGAGAVGTSSGGVGTIFAGGSGATGASGNPSSGGGGGGGAGTGGAGGNASGATGGTGTADLGGAGGTGGNREGSAGSSYGGGGAGGGKNLAGGAGAPGYARLTYTVPNETTAGTVTATAASSTSITVSMPYTADGNVNNTYTVQYRLHGSSSWQPWVTAAAHAPSPYATVITGLIAGASYDVLAAFNDSDGVSGTNPQQFYSIVLAQQTYGPGTSTWTAPTGVTSVIVELWAGGGGGGGAKGSSSYAGGGAGGQYAKAAVSVTPGDTYIIVVGAGGSAGGGTGQTPTSGAGGGDSTFAASVVVAKGGSGGSASSSGSASGGAAAIRGAGTGDVVRVGGSGASGTGSSGGGGGGGAGSTSDASSSTGAVGGNGGSPDGGNGGQGSGTPGAGGTYGGGGGGATGTSGGTSGAVGGAGFARLTYLIGTTTSVSASPSTQASGQSITFTVNVTSGDASTPGSATLSVYDGTSGTGTQLGTCSFTGSSCTVTSSALSVGSHTVWAYYPATNGYQASAGSTAVTITKPLQATLRITDPTTATYGETHTIETSGGSGTGAVTFFSKTASICTISGSQLHAVGVGSCTIYAQKAEDATYAATTSGDFTLAVSKATPAVGLTSNHAPDATYGTTVLFTATVTSGVGTPTGSVSFSDGLTSLSCGPGSHDLTAGSATCAVSSLLVTGSPHTITAHYGGDTNYVTAEATTGQVITAKALTISASDGTKIYGDNSTGSLTGIQATGFSVTGLVGTDSVTSVTLTSSGAGPGANVGTYAITPSAASGSGLANYTISYTDGTLTVVRRPLVISASDGTKTYGTAWTTRTDQTTGFSVSGLANLDTVVSASLVYDASGGTASVGVYLGSITARDASFGTGSVSNYTITYPSSGTLTVTARPLTISASDGTKTYSVELTTLIEQGAGFSVTGLADGDTVTSVSLVYDTSAGSATASVGDYPGSITARDASFGTGSVSNYTITYPSSGKLTIQKVGSAITLTCPGNPFTYDGNPHGCSARWTSSGTDGSGGTATIVYSGTDGTTYVGPDATSATGTYLAVATFTGDANHDGSLDFTTFTIGLSPQQTLTIKSGQSFVYSPSGTFTPETSGGTGQGAITFESADPTVCLAKGSALVTIVAAGDCRLTATKAADTEYASATSVSEGVTITQAPQSITVGTPAPATASFGSNFVVRATASSGDAVTYDTNGVCKVAVFDSTSATIEMTAGTGECVVRFNQAGNANYFAAAEVTSGTSATKASQSITVGTKAPATAAQNSTFTVAATASSGDAVTYAASGVCRVAASDSTSATIEMTAATGTCVVSYDQAGNSDYDPAPELTSGTAAAADLWTITASISSGDGTMTPLGAQTLAGGSDATYDITAATFYSIGHVWVDGADQGSRTTYTFTKVVANHSIVVSFTPPTLLAEASAGTATAPPGFPGSPTITWPAGTTGTTTVTFTPITTPPPGAAALGTAAVFVDIHLDPMPASSLTICIDGGPATHLYHFNGTSWVDVTTSHTPTQVCGTVTSTSPLGVITPPPAGGVETVVRPLFTLHPSDATVVPGGTAPFRAAASPTTVELRWQVSTDGGRTWADIPGIAGGTLTVTALAGDNGKLYRAVAVNGSVTRYSRAARLTVATIAGPGATTVLAGGWATLVATTTVLGASIAWQTSLDGRIWTQVAGAVGPTLRFKTTAGDDGHWFRAVLTSDGTTFATNPARLTVVSVGSIGPLRGGVGTSIVIRGTGLTGATRVTFGGVASPRVVVLSRTTIWVSVPAGAKSGRILVRVGSVVAVGPSFTVTARPKAPTIKSLSSTRVRVGRVLTLRGTNLIGATAVRIGSVRVTFRVVNATTIVIVVPARAIGGRVTLRTAGGLATSTVAVRILR